MIILKNLFSKIVVDAFVNDQKIIDAFPIDNSIKYFPEWLKKLPFDVEVFDKNLNMSYPTATIKRCPGIIELFKKSYTMPLWADVIININENSSWSYKSPHEKVLLNSHDRWQYGSIFDDFFHFKLSTPWLIKSKSDVNFLVHPSTWNNVRNWNHIYFVTGMIEYKYQNEHNINFFLKNEPQSIMLSAGMPLVMMTPLTEKKVVIKNHMVTSNEWQNIFDKQKNNYHFTKSYLKFKKLYESKK